MAAERTAAGPAVVSFVHQKGGTGKSTLAIASALALRQQGARVLLLDADYQGTSSEWGNRFGMRYGVETRSQVQPIVHREVARFAGQVDWLIVDAPPTLSEMTESVLRASGRAIVPLRPALPDVWALPWLAAIVGKLRAEGHAPEVRVVFNQYAGEDLAPLRREIAEWGLPVHDEPLPADAAFGRVFAGDPLPAGLARKVLHLLGAEPAAPEGEGSAQAP